jgi:serine protease AprX
VANTKRTKPDIVAPGVCILSARASSDSVQSKLEEWVKSYGTFPGGGKQTDKLAFNSGTSMAAPGVSGCAALLREALAKWPKLQNPSAPLMKALLINGADDLRVSRNDQGFGQIDMTRTLKPVRSSVSGAAETSGCGYEQGTALSKDLATMNTFKTTAPSRSENKKKLNFIATLVYHDAKGEQIQNKMNLIVTYQGQVTETYNATVNENVLRVALSDVVSGETITIGVQPKLIAVSGTAIPWGLAWDHFET